MLKALNNIWKITKRELRAFSRRPIFLMIMFVAPLGFLWLFTSGFFRRESLLDIGPVDE